MTATLFTAGEALAVFLSDETDLSASRRFERIISGAEVNVAAGFVAAGHRARVVTRVGNDAFGRSITAALDAWGVEGWVIVDPDRPTGVLVRSVGGLERGEAVHLRRGAAIEALSPLDIEQAWIEEANAVFVSGTTAVRSQSAAAAVAHLVGLARGAGALVVADLNLRPALGSEEEFERAFTGVRGKIDVALGDLHELALLAGCRESSAVDNLLERGARLVVEKRGPDGVVAHDGVGRHYHPALVDSQQVVDTVGAGDAFAAELIAATLEGKSTEELLARASHAASRVVRTRGDIVTASQAKEGLT